MILVFGGTGFVGRNLVSRLHAQGRAAFTVSRRPDPVFLAGYAPSIDGMTVEAFFADPESALHGTTAVIYLATTSTPGANLEAPWREAADNVAPLMKVMQTVASRSKAHFIYLSSGGAVYGQATTPLLSEDHPRAPISPYGLGKHMAEIAVEFMARTRGLRATVLRPSNPIGPWQKSLSQGVVGVLMRAALTGSPFPMLGDGSAVRDYFDVRDLTTALLAVVDAPEASAGQTWNVGSGRGHSVREMRDLVAEITGKTISTNVVPARTSDVDRVVLDIRRIRDQLGWSPEIPLETSLADIWRDLSQE